MPKVSVLLPNYNHAQYLELRLNSILNQTFQDYELIILDDNSQDKSRSIIEKFRNNGKISHIIYNSQNSGSVFAQWVKGINLAKGEYIWIAESDDFCDETFLEQTYKVIIKDSSIGIVFTASELIFPNETKSFLDFFISTFRREPPLTCHSINGNEYIQNYLMNACSIINVSSVLINKRYVSTRMLEEVTKYKFFGDWFFYINVLQNSNIVFINKELNKFRRPALAHTYKIDVKMYLKERSDILLEQSRILVNVQEIEKEFDKIYYMYVSNINYWIYTKELLIRFVKIMRADRNWFKRLLIVLRYTNV